MSFYSFDPREDIRKQIGYSYDCYNENVEHSCVSVYDSLNNIIYLPLLFPGEARSGDLPTFPYIEMVLVDAPSETRSITGLVKKQNAYLDFNIYYANTDNISVVSFGRVVASVLCDLLTDNQSSVASTCHVEVIDDGREIQEYKDTLLVFHRIVEVHCSNWNL